MKLTPYLERLSTSQEYKDFQEKNPQAFPTAGFFVLDLETKQNIHQIDYFIPKKKKVAAFTLDNPEKVQVQMMDLMSDKTPEHLDLTTNTDLDQLEGILEDEMKNRGDTEKIKKIIAVLQTLDGRKIWNLNCVCSGMEILKAHVNDADKTVLKMDKASVLDFVKQVPGQKGMPQLEAGGKPLPQMQLPGAPQNPQQPTPTSPQPADHSPDTNSAEGASEKKPSKKQLKEEIAKIDKLEQALEKEKQNLKKATEEKE